MYLFAQIILAVEEEGEGGLGILAPATSELIAGIVAFGIVFFFVWRWAVPAINRTLENRQKAIAGSLEEAEKAKADAQSLLDDYQQQLAGAKEEANRILEEARTNAESMRSDIVNRANSEADQITSKAREEAAAEAGRAMDSVRSEVANLSVDLAEKVVGGSLDRETQLGLVEQYIRDLEGAGE